MVKVDLEVDVVPLLVGVGLSTYQSTAIEDGCFWIHNDWQGITVKTTLTKNIARCGENVKSIIDDADDWTQIFSFFNTANM
jgi:hypothetical protein